MGNGLDGDPVGFAARQKFGSTLQDILLRFERKDHGTVGDTNTSQLSDDAEPLAAVAVFDQTNGEVGMFLINGATNESTKVAEAGGGTVFGTAQGSNSVNVYHDGSAYVVENQTGGDADLESAMLRAA